MKYSARRGHPLDISGADLAASPCGVLMLKLALIHDRHRFEPALRMLACPSPVPRGRKIRGLCIIEQ
ncbi:hypothetical protein D3C73_1534030 [compost metagenome]